MSRMAFVLVVILSGLVTRLATGLPPAPAPFQGVINLSTVGSTTPGAAFYGPGRIAASRVSNIGDFNGDGLDDFAVGANIKSAGGVYVVYGSNQPFTGDISLGQVGVTIPGVVFEGISELPEGLSAAGDVNGDGFADLLIGDEEAELRKGRVYLAYGGSTLPATVPIATLGKSIPGAVFTGFMQNDRLGWGVSGGGDLNGDGVGDIAFGAWGSEHGIENGQAFVVYGQTGANALAGDLDLASVGSTIPGVRIDGMAKLRLGYDVSLMRDANGDGIGDLLIGAPSGEDRGYVVYGGAGAKQPHGTLQASQIGVTIPGLTVVDTSPGGGFASSTAALDFNGDGLTDFVFGNSDVASGHGRAYLVYGKMGMGPGSISVDDLGASVPAFVIDGPASDITFFGFDLANAGDVNGDGADELIVGAWISNASAMEAGQAFLIYGVPGASPKGHFSATDIGQSIAGAVFNGAARGDHAGAFVASGGDVNGDGADDLLIGAPLADTSADLEAGKAYLLYGAVVPEPASIMLWGVGSAILIFRRAGKRAG